MVNALAIDIGSTSIRTALVDERGTVTHVHHQRLTVRTREPGEVELDAMEIVDVARFLALKTLSDGGPCSVVGITNQRATTIVFDPLTGNAVGPALSWQDLRTVIDCLILQSEGLRLAPNQSATKVKWLLNAAGVETKTLRFATIETWVAWHLSEGATFVTDRSNAAVTGLVNLTLDGWDQDTLSILGLSEDLFPTIVDTMGLFGLASALPGSPPIVALVGDQSASLFGQSCVRKGAKITFGTGAMLDMIVGSDAPSSLNRFPSGCFPIIARSSAAEIVWAIEGIVLSAGTCVEWLEDLGLVASPEESSDLAASVDGSDGVSFVPAFSGLGTPQWDFGARGGFFGLTRGSTRAHLVRAVLEGVAHRGADLLDAAENEIGSTLSELRIDGGMSANQFFVQRLADFSGHVVSVSSEREATTRGVGLMALVSAGHLSLANVEALWSPAQIATPSLDEKDRLMARASWSQSLLRAEKSIPELSGVTF
jgi:glycerol kinase